MIQLERLLILLVWPGLGLASLVCAVRWFAKRKSIRATLATLFGLGLIVSFAVSMWFVAHMFDPVDGTPDSPTSEQGFESLVGYSPPPSISDLHYRCEGFVDPMFLMRFQCSDAETMHKIIQSLNLKPVGEAKSEILVPDVEWWKRSTTSVYKVFAAEYDNLCKYLWVDEMSGTVFYQEYGM